MSSLRSWRDAQAVCYAEWLRARSIYVHFMCSQLGVEVPKDWHMYYWPVVPFGDDYLANNFSPFQHDDDDISDFDVLNIDYYTDKIAKEGGYHAN